ncbi:hypothetical protein RRG08_014909 [Elysia crispata]|uniref:Cadherin domain-containing protein n=1 Tax=Elysia crispata TaxID=231223 RepID=A0AAE1CMN2_9GAST|nr:hypothetical protein RRG08_014909 [Elysia crispata]
MGWRESPPSSPLLLCLFALLMFALSANAQSSCNTPTIVNLEFPEGREDAPIPANAVGFSKLIQATSNQPSTFSVEDTDVSTKNFTKYFDINFYGFANPPGIYIDMKLGIDRDGPTSSVDDDVDILQYRIVCQALPGSNIFSVLNIGILDQNDNPPQFVNAPYSFNVNELTPVGLTVFRLISSTDLDEGDNKQVEYFLEKSPTAQFDGTPYFEIPLLEQGQISVTRTLDFESMLRATNGNASETYFNMTLTAKDKGIPPRSSETFVIITISDGDDLGPEFIYDTCLPSKIPNGKNCVRPNYRTTIESNSNQASTLVFTPVPVDQNNPTATTDIIIQDRDSLNNAVRCQVVSTVPIGYENRFQSFATLVLGSAKQYRCSISYLANSSISRSTVPTLDLIVLIQEESEQGRIDYATVEVTVMQANNFDPVISASSTIGYILENSRRETIVSETLALDNLLKLTFSDQDMLPTDPEQGYDIIVSGGAPFTVSADGYVLLNTETLDYETNPQYTLIVRIREQSGGRESNPISLTINVVNENDFNPVFDSNQNYVGSIVQGVYSAPQVLLTIKILAPPSYLLINTRADPASSPGTLTVSPNGVLSLSGTLTAGETYFAFIRATDQGTPPRSADTTVVVNVTPLDNQPPRFTSNQYTIFVSEAVPQNSNLFVLPATDPNSSILVFHITSITPQNFFPFFTINGNILLNARVFDRESIEEHKVSVRVADTEGNFDTAEVTVSILDANDESPKFTQPSYSFVVDENQPRGTNAGKVQASDNDLEGSPNSRVYYSILPGLDGSDFSIDGSSGKLTALRPFDYELKNVYQVLVEATDLGVSPRETVVPVTVYVRDLQDSPPVSEETTSSRSAACQNKFQEHLSLHFL